MQPAGPLQVRCLSLLWGGGPSTVNDVHAALNAQPGAPQLAYTTILTVMRNLVRRKLCEVAKGARRHVFVPTVTREEYRAGVARWLVAEQFAGDMKAAAAAVAAVC